MSAADFPDNLRLSTWDKKKDSVPKGHEVADKLKALQKKHEAVGWKAFEAPTWAKPCKKLEELEQAFAQCDRSYRASVFALKKDANDLAAAALKMGKEKAAAKPAQEAAKSIGAAVSAYAKAIDEGVDELKAIFEKARQVLVESEDDKEPPEPPAALLDPKKLAAVLQLCKREPARRVQFGFVDGKDKQAPALAMHIRQSGRKLFSGLQEATGVKVGAYGIAWVDNTTLYLQVEKNFSGLATKVRRPLKAAGFRVSKIILWKDDGTVLEQDEDLEEVADGAAESGPGGAAEPGTGAALKEKEPQASGDEQAKFNARRMQLLPKIAAALATPEGAKAKLMASEAGVFAGKRDWTKANALLKAAEGLVGGSGGASTEPQPAKSSTPALASTVVYKQSQLVWSQTRDKVRSELQRLEAAILEVYDGDAVLPKVTQAVRKLDTVLQKFDTSLVEKIDQINLAASDDERAKLHGEARAIVKRYQGFLASDPLVQKLDENPFARLGVQATLKKSLEMLAAKIA
jgi:hypothetical protein